MQAQTLSIASLNGKYFVRHIEFTTDANNNTTDARSVAGALTFNGAGQYSIAGQQVIGTGSAASFSASGTYTVSPAGVVTLTNPQKPAVNINARYGAEAVAGASTEASDNTFDLFVAIPAPTTAVTAAGLSATFYATDFELPGGSTAQVRDSFFTAVFDGAGNVTGVAPRGHAANVNAGAPFSYSVAGATYSVNSDGSGALALPPPAGIFSSGTLLSSTQRTLFLSRSGNVVLAGTPGGHDILIAVKAFAGSAANGSLAVSSWLAGIRVDSAGSSESYAGSVKAFNSILTSSRRLHETGSATPIDETATQPYTISAAGTGSSGPSGVGLGSGGNLLVSADASAQFDPTGYEISFEMASPALAGNGVFINPQGVVNAASFAPGVDAISPGEFIAIYGTGLAAQAATSLPPYPPSLGGVSVTIGGIQAPIYFAGPTQINCLVPYALTGASANIVATNNGVVSNVVTVPVAKTSPGMFSLDGTGANDAAILHLDATVVNDSSPAKKGETVVLYMTGLGALTAPVPDGQGATAADSATTALQLYVNGVPVAPADLLYAGLSALPGLYQINFRVPSTLTVSGDLPLAILTPDAFHDQASIAVQ